MCIFICSEIISYAFHHFSNSQTPQVSNTQVDTDLGASPKTAFRPPDLRWELYSKKDLRNRNLRLEITTDFGLYVKFGGGVDPSKTKKMRVLTIFSYHTLTWFIIH